jgi:hypothetical protein
MFPRVTHPSAARYCYLARLACVRPAASVRSEPGSNSQVESAEALSLTSNLRTSVINASASMISLCLCAKPSEDGPTKTVKLTPTSSESHLAATPLVGRYASVQRRNVQTARISLQNSTVSKSTETKINRNHQSYLVRPTNSVPEFPASHQRPLAPPLRSAPVAALAASVRRYLRIDLAARKRKKTEP